MKQTRPVSKLILAAIFEFVIAIDLIFPAWLGVDFYFGKTNATLWRFSQFIDTVTGYTDSNFILTLVMILIYVLLVLSLIAVVITGYSIVRAFKNDTPVQDAGFYVPAALSVLVILIVIIGNIIVKSETDGWLTDIFYLESAPIVILILSVVGILLCKKVPDSAFTSMDQKLQNVGASVGATVTEAGKATASAIHSKTAAKTITCPNCGAACSSGTAFCASCGTKLPQPFKCTGCGKELAPNTKFCPYCGKPALTATGPSAPVTPAAPTTPVTPAPSGEADPFQKSPPL